MQKKKKQRTERKKTQETLRKKGKRGEKVWRREEKEGNEPRRMKSFCAVLYCFAFNE